MSHYPELVLAIGFLVAIGARLGSDLYDLAVSGLRYLLKVMKT